MITQKRLEKITHVVAQRQNGVIVVFEDVSDPHNAAAVLRSADAFGIQNAYFVFGNTEVYDPKTIGKASSSSANKWIDTEIFTDIEICMDQLHQNGYSIIATVADSSTADSLFEANLTHEKIAILFGNEHYGLSQYALDHSDQKLTIPMAGMVQSLNISVTAGICMFEIIRQRKQSNKLFSFSSTDQEHLINEFTKRV